MKSYHAEKSAGRRLGQRSLLALGVALACPMAAHAISFSGNDWTVDLSGEVNAYYTFASCNGSGANLGGSALAGKSLGCGNEQNRTTIGNGLLPDALTTKFTTQQQGIDIAAQISLMPSVATSDSLSSNNNIDVRQAFLTLGTPDIGTFKLGRDYGLFGLNVILNDMTLIGVGAPVQATQRDRVSLGHIGAGYTYTGSYGQILYTTPGTSGFSFSGGLFSPVDNTANYDSHSAPQAQAQVSYSQDGFKVWLGAKTQRFYADAGTTGAPDFTMVASELGASWTVGGFTLFGNVQEGRGLGILTDGDQGDIRGVNYLLQGTYAVTDKLKLGLNGGISRNRTALEADANLKSNTNVTAGAYYALTKSVTLSLELSQTRSKYYYTDETARMNGVSFGGILFF